MAAPKRLYAVEVEWVDSAFNRGWGNAAVKTREMDISICRTVGYLISRDKKAIKLAMNSADNDESLGDGISIPAVAVRRVTRLTK